jgi:hypothetical protein
MNDVNQDVVSDTTVSIQAVEKDVSTNEVTPSKPKRGRPRKDEIRAKMKPGKVGRPIGDTGRIQELKARLLATTGDKVINKIVEIALQDGHPVQAAALKMCIDRVLPISYFEKDKQGGSRPSVSITITGVGGEQTIINGADSADDVTDVEYEEHKDV